MKTPDWIDQVLSRDVDIERVRAFVAAHGDDDEELRAAFARLPESEQRAIKGTLARNAA
jgi:hypothetical protein